MKNGEHDREVHYIESQFLHILFVLVLVIVFISNPKTYFIPMITFVCCICSFIGAKNSRGKRAVIAEVFCMFWIIVTVIYAVGIYFTT